MSEIESLSTQALADIAAAQSPEVVEQLRVALLGKNGSITTPLKQLGALPADQRKAAGEAINRARDAIGEALSVRKSVLEDAALDARLAGEAIDVTLPGRNGTRGGLHPISRTLERIADIFGRLGYELADGPDAPSEATGSHQVWIPLSGFLQEAEEGELGWQTEALCAQTDPEAFFPEKGGSTRDAKKVCSSCTVRAECLEYALANDERFGIWGGLSERERRRLRKRAN